MNCNWCSWQHKQCKIHCLSSMHQGSLSSIDHSTYWSLKYTVSREMNLFDYKKHREKCCIDLLYQYCTAENLRVCSLACIPCILKRKSRGSSSRGTENSYWLLRWHSSHLGMMKDTSHPIDNSSSCNSGNHTPNFHYKFCMKNYKVYNCRTRVLLMLTKIQWKSPEGMMTCSLH